MSLASGCSGEWRENESLAMHTTWHVGGCAQYTYRPSSIQDLSHLLQQIPPELPVTWLGLGSNVLIRDGGIPGLVIFTQGCLKQIELFTCHPERICPPPSSCHPRECGDPAGAQLDPRIRGDDRDDSVELVRAEAGVPCAKVAKFCAKHPLGQASFFAGIPGTVGGALAMNAGAFGGETWTHVVAVETINRAGQVRVREPSEFTIGYRSVTLPAPEWFIAAHFAFPPGDTELAQTQIRQLLRLRETTQPIGLPSAGSVFRNPPNDAAARLIDTCGLKGLRIGRAIVSEKHANFMVNEGGAKASDIEQLIEQVARTVYEQTGVILIPEVRMLGVHSSV